MMHTRNSKRAPSASPTRAPASASLQTFPITVRLWKRGLSTAVDKRPNESDPQGPLYHTVRVFLIDRAGRIRNIYSSATLDPRLVLADVKTLLLEESKPSK